VFRDSIVINGCFRSLVAMDSILAYSLLKKNFFFNNSKIKFIDMKLNNYYAHSEKV